MTPSLSGQKNPKILDSYVVVSHAQQREMSKILYSIVLYSNILYPKSYIQNLVLPCASAPSDWKTDSNGKKRRRLIIESSDKED